jgi:hypothetical protein
LFFAQSAYADQSASADVQPTSALTISGPAQASVSSAQPAAAHKSRKKAIEESYAFANRKGILDLHLVGADANSETNTDALKAGETSHKYVGVEMGGTLGSLATTQFQVRFTEAQSDPTKALFDLEPANQNADSRRAMQDFSTTSNFLGDLLTLSSYQRTSSLALIDASGEDTKGQLEQHHIAAALWRSDRADLDFDAALSRTSSNYWDFGDSPDSDLHANNSRIAQFRSKFRLDRFGLSVMRRDTSTLVAATAGGFEPSRSDTDAKISVDVADWRDEIGLAPVYRRLIPLPDSIWVSADNGLLNTNDASTILHQSVNKMSLGASRAFTYGSINASYWQSVTEPTRDTASGYHGTGHGIDLGSKLNFGPWGVTGNVSLANNQNFAVGTDNQENTFNSSFFVTWKAPLNVGIKAGVSTNLFQNEYVDYGSLERNNSLQYQVALDLSQIAATGLADENVQLKLLASFQGNQSRSPTDAVSNIGTMFTGLQFAIPLHQ